MKRTFYHYKNLTIFNPLVDNYEDESELEEEENFI